MTPLSPWLAGICSGDPPWPLGNISSRIRNPTQAAVEERLAALASGLGALLVSSRQKAETIALLNIAGAGDHMASSLCLYGAPKNWSITPCPSWPSWCPSWTTRNTPASWRAAVRSKTKACFGEAIANPNNDILVIEADAAVAHPVGVPLVVDNTVATPYLIRPMEWGTTWWCTGALSLSGATAPPAAT